MRNMFACFCQIFFENQASKVKNVLDIICFLLKALIDGPPGTPYAGGVFRVKLALSRDYPASPPKGHFLTKIFHPNVGPQVRMWNVDGITRFKKCLLIRSTIRFMKGHKNA